MIDIRTVCPECGKRFKIPSGFTKKKGRCPACKKLIEINSLKKWKVNSTRQEVHPLLYITKKFTPALLRYAGDLQKVYKLIRSQLIHKKDYEKQKKLLREEAFLPIVDELNKLPAFDLNRNIIIELWKNILNILPVTYPDKDPSIKFNLYPRYEYAALACCSSVLSGLDDKTLTKKILKRAFHGEKNSKPMKNLIKKVLESDYREEFISRSILLLEEIRNIPEAESIDLNQLKEDFNFGFSWISFHIPDH